MQMYCEIKFTLSWFRCLCQHVQLTLTRIYNLYKPKNKQNIIYSAYNQIHIMYGYTKQYNAESEY